MKIGQELKAFLDEKAEQYGNPELFIPSDPIQIPHQFSDPKDQEVVGFFTALIAWGQRPTIIKNAQKWVEALDGTPYQYLMHAKPQEFNHLDRFVHRTMNGIDAIFITERLSRLIKMHGSIDRFLMQFPGGAKEKLVGLHHFFVFEQTLPRTAKHIANPSKGSAAKRLNMYFRWMVRKNKSTGVDFGIWKCLEPKDLMLPLDVHTGNVSRKLGLLNRKQSDWKAVDEITHNLRNLDKMDPIKYDYALFGLGAFEGF
ncbi:TIGR02757 family protein [Luteibaculum oceani]|uniref:TIGR02757 family protein n=1 Tax=Luteibaculum oceani TaxID=1294296 RepID=A0A5C6UZ16_9FLAO|nr:TIGR02757 family protein [Luteibaculum oceani]TXC78662.1 TIGR02757 family protein [Luteibaculum oceani]